MKRLTSITLALVLLAALSGPASAGVCAASYTVKPGDTLRQIGLKFGVTWQSIASANSLANPNLIYIGRVLCIPGAASAPQPVPTFTIVGVSGDKSVTIQTANFPANQTFQVRMGPIGTRGVNGTSVGTTQSGAGGSFTATYKIPANLKGSYQISIRLENAVYFAYNWFYNGTTSP